MFSVSGNQSLYEDAEAIARISSVETQLQDEFLSFQNEQLQNFYLAQGYILSARDLAKLIKEKRPHFQSNLFNPKILQLAGNFVENMPGVDVYGTTEDDHKKAAMFKALNDHINYTWNAIEYELAKAYILSIIGRISWLQSYYTFNAEDPLGQVVIEAYSPFLKFDTSVTNLRTMKDCNFMSDDAWLSPEEICQKYAKNNPSLRDEIMGKAADLLGESATQKAMLAKWSERLMNLVVEYGGEIKGYDEVQRVYDKFGQWHNARGRFKTIDWYERRDVPVMYLFNWMNNKRYDISEHIRVKEYGKDWYDNDKLQMIRMNYPQAKIEEDYESRIYQTSIVPGLFLKVYDRQQQLQNRDFKFTPIFCYDFHPNVLETKSVIDHIKDPVRSYNLRDNTNLTYLMRAAHGGYLAEESAVKGKINTLREGANKIGGIDVLNNGAISGGKIKEKGVPQINAGIERYQQMKAQEVDTISGVGLNSVGQQESANESGKLFNARVQQSDIMQAWVVNNANYSLQSLSKKNLWFVQNFMKEERTFRIMQDFSDPYWLTINKRVLGEVINDVSIGSFDIVISKTSIGRQGREIEFAKAMELTQLLMQINPQFVDAKEIVKLSTLTNRSAWIKRIEMVEGILESQMKEAEAADQMQKDAESEKNLLDFASQYAGIENQLLQNRQLASTIDYENMLSQITGL